MYLAAAGMVCSVGLNAAAACAAMRAGIAKFDELPYCDNRGEPIVGAMVPGVPRSDSRVQPLIDLLVMALADCLRVKQVEPLERVPLLVGLGEPGRPGGAELGDDLIREVEGRLSTRFNPTHSRVIGQGHTAGFHALRVARELMQAQGLRVCIVCGVDSYMNAPSLLWLDQSSRLKTVDNSDGVIPGEAAAAVLVRSQVAPRSPCAVRVAGLGFSHETAGILSEEPVLGLGLTQATRAALGEAGIQIHETAFRLSDVTGESYGFKEQALVVGRLLRKHLAKFPLWHCGECIGDTGASAGICQLAVAFHAFAKGYAPGNRAICFTSSVPGDRAVAILHREETPA